MLPVRVRSAPCLPHARTPQDGLGVIYLQKDEVNNMTVK